MLPNVLSLDEVEQFVDLGYVVLRNAFDASVADRVLDLVWAGVEEKSEARRDDPSTWTQGYVHLPISIPAKDAYTPRWLGAIDDVAGPGRANPNHLLGWWPVIFPGFAEKPWAPPQKGWHVDGIHFHHHVHSAEQGLLTIAVFSELEAGDGGTCIVPGSHKQVARMLAASEPQGIDHKELNTRVKDEIPRDHVVEVTGSPGDVVIMHPFMLHAAGINTGSRPRIICNPCIELHEDMKLDRPNSADHSPCERAIREAIAASTCA